MKLSQLPFDVLDALAAFLSPPDLANFSLAASAFALPAAIHLFRDIALDSEALATRCLPILAANKHLAAHARSFSLRLDPAVPLPVSLLPLLALALRNMHRLLSLDLSLPQNAASAFAPDTLDPHNNPIYPRLRHFSSNLPLDPSLVHFLTRTPSLTQLHLGEHPHPNPNQAPTPLDPPLAFPPTALPLLSVFWGPPDVAASLVPGRPLESVHVYYGQLSSRVASALALSTSPIAIFSALTQSLSPTILRQLAQSLPHVRHLRIMTMYHHASTQPDEAFYGQVVQILSDLPQLVTAELAGFRWACPKEPSIANTTGNNTTGSHNSNGNSNNNHNSNSSSSSSSNGNGNGNTNTRRKPEAVRAHPPTPPSVTSDLVANAEFNDYAHY